jgi:GT2 family glycosyltransferase
MDSGARDPAAPGAITAVVVNYNGAEHLGPCLEALFAQTRPPTEVIVVDNASSDGSRELVRERFPRAQLIELGENRGPCPARNRGLEEARSSWVLILDNDAVLAPDALERLSAAAAANPDAALIQPRSVHAAEPDRVHYDGGRFHYAGLFSLRNAGVRLAQAEGSGVVEVDGAISVALLARREAVLEAGGFDGRYFILFEDLDLSYRLRLAGLKILSVEDAIVLHRGGTPGISFRQGGYPARRAWLHSRNRWIFLAKNYRASTLLAALPGLAAYELAWLAFTLASGTFLEHVEGKVAFLQSLGDVLDARDAVQKRRQVADRDLLVGGPLTVTPQLAANDASAAALRLLDRLLAAWWEIGRRFSG